MSHWEDAYNEKVVTLRSVQALVDVLQNDLDKEREHSRRLGFQLTELQKALHCSRVGACVQDDRPVVTFVTTMRKSGREMHSVATMVDEMLVMASKDPKGSMGRELNSHLCMILDSYLGRHNG